MKIAIPKEIKTLEGRVGLIPAACAELVKQGHEVFIETGAGRLTGETPAADQPPVKAPGKSDAPAVLKLPDPPPGRPVKHPQIGGPPGIALPDLLKFDITPAWLGQNWSRVTTCLTEPDWQGLRVPVVTGTEPSDLAGTVTYSFNMQQQLERIHLYGLTGDVEPIVAFVQ